MKIVVLGAGVIGVTSAWFLRQAGHEVTVVDRQPGAAQETSFANGGQISVSHAEPWANPHAPLQALRWLGREDAPLLFRLRADPALWAWGLRFLNECRASRTRDNIRQIVSLGLYSRAQLGALRQKLGLQYDQMRRGILHFYTDTRHFEAAQVAAAVMRDQGCDRRIISTDEAVLIEPVLAAMRQRIVGADFTPDDESGDAQRFTELLAEQSAQAGVNFLWQTGVRRLRMEQGRVSAVELTGKDGAAVLTADAFVVALGSYSAPFLRQHGLSIPVVPAKGYSATFALSEQSIAPEVSLTDDACKIVISRLGQRLRVAGTAEFNGYNLDLNPVRCALLYRRTKELFPQLAPVGEPDYWTGLRPATPSNRPLIGRFGAANLFLNTGHGTLGWTLSCGSAAALTTLIERKRPAPEFSFLGA